MILYKFFHTIFTIIPRQISTHLYSQSQLVVKLSGKYLSSPEGNCFLELDQELFGKQDPVVTCCTTTITLHMLWTT